MRMKRLLTIAGIGMVLCSPLYSLDVKVTVPTVQPQGQLENVAQQAGIDFQAIIDQELGPLATQLEGQIEESEEVQRFSDLTLVTQGFANAGAAASHLGTPRAFADYRLFAFVLGTGVTAAAPTIDPGAIGSLGEDIEEEGDIYAGASTQPLNAALGINLSRWLDRTRAYVKVGYFDLPAGAIADEVSFNSLSIGAGIGYQVFRTRQLPLGFLRWRGLTANTGFLFQRNETNVDIDVADQGFEPDAPAITFGDLNFTNDQFNDAGIDLTEDTEVGTIAVSPTLSAAIESRTVSIPLEVTTGLRILWLLDLNVGAGIDLVFGSSELSLGANADAEFVVSDKASQYVTSTPGSANFSITSKEGPNFFRPRLTAGAGLNLGPVKLDVPAMLYFDREGYTVMAGVNVGIVW